MFCEFLPFKYSQVRYNTFTLITSYCIEYKRSLLKTLGKYYYDMAFRFYRFISIYPF